MKTEELAAFCDQNKIDWKVVGAEEAQGEGFLFHWNNPNDPQDGECVHVTPQALEGMTSAVLRKVVINGRDVKHTTRIVGYFSSIQNWNRSKLGELKDRHKGNYSVPAQR